MYLWSALFQDVEYYTIRRYNRQTNVTKSVGRDERSGAPERVHTGWSEGRSRYQTVGGAVLKRGFRELSTYSSGDELC